MNGRQRSPSYPSTPLSEAIDLIRKMHLIERTNPIDRGVAAKAIGYSGISGRSATVLSNLIQYGLLEKTGKNEVRVTRRAVDILYPDTEESKAVALHEAANEPELFNAIADKFPDGRPSETAIEAFLIRQGYTHAAVKPATRAFLETFLFLENTMGSGSHLHGDDDVIESQPNQRVERNFPMAVTPQPQTRAASPMQFAGGPVDGFDVRIAQRRLWLAGTVGDRAEADELIEVIKLLRDRLPEAAKATLSEKDEFSN